MAGRRHVILGDGAAGMSAAETLRRLDPAGSITVVSDDPHPTYFRAALTNYLLGELREDQIWAVPPSFYRDLGASRVLARAVAVDTSAGSVRLASGGAVPYESLLVATGARPRPAPFAGGDLGGVLSLRTLQDARAVMDLVLDGRAARAVVVGGGPLALEWAHALRERGLAVTLLARGERLMPEVLDATASDLLLARLRRGGIDARLGEEAAEALAGPGGRVSGVRTASGETIACELVGVAIGVVCNTELLAGSGVTLGPRGGVAVDDRMRASAPRVYAAGDVAELGGRLLQLWEPARRTAEVAATNMAGGDARHAAGAHYFATRLHDLDFAAVGALDAAPGDVELKDHPGGTGTLAYRRLVLRDGRVRGALMLGEREAGVRRRGRLWKRLVDLGADVTSVAGSLLDPGFDLHGWIERRAIVARPPPPAAGHATARNADVRGTQRVVLPGASAARSPRAAEDARTVAAGPMLSIGLRLPGEAPPVEEDAPAAHLEGPRGQVPLAREVVSLGRHASATVVLDDPAISSRHAEIVCHEGVRYVRDAGSRNGTRVNGELVTTPHPLRDGDRIRLGGVDLVFRGGKPDKARDGKSERNRDPSAPVAPTMPDEAAVSALTVLVGPGRGLSFALEGAQVTVGREPSCDVRLDDLSVSRRHAVLADHGGRWHVADLHSSRGTTLNGARLPAGDEAPLAEGDTLSLGDVVLVFARRARSVMS